jgi:hypothetical protein
MHIAPGSSRAPRASAGRSNQGGAEYPRRQKNPVDDDVSTDNESQKKLTCRRRVRECYSSYSLRHRPLSSYPTIEDIRARVSDAAFGRPLITNVLRGLVAEAIIATALEPEWSWCSSDYSSWDFERADGSRIEVKQSAARQTWSTGSAPSKCRFDIRARQGRWEGPDWIAEPGRNAGLYIFAHQPVSTDLADHRDPQQWVFYVVAAAELPEGASLSLQRVRSLAPPTAFSELRERVRASADSRVPTVPPTFVERDL